MEKSLVTIDEWSVVSSPFDPYLAPELLDASLHGKIKGHSEFPDGSFVTTSAIMFCYWEDLSEFDGLEKFIVETRNTRYVLLTPSARYLEFLKNKNIPFDPTFPIKAKSRW